MLIPLLWLLPGSVQAEDVAIRWQNFQKNYATKLAELGTWCREHQLAEQAALTQAWLPEQLPDQLTLYVIDSSTQHYSSGSDASADVQTWAKQFREIREIAGQFLFQLATQAVKEEKYSVAMRLLHATVHEDPDHTEARAALNYELVDGVWSLPHAKSMKERGQVWDDRFGWIAAEDVARYEQGERKLGTRWVDAATDAARRRAILGGWQIRTEHYEVTTNHSLEAGTKLALQLERLNQVWRQLFVEHYASKSDLKQMLRGKATDPSPEHVYEVFLYRDKADYVQDLRSAQPQIDKTIGIYFDNRRRAYFFMGEENYAGNTYHEATHQLFQETRRVPRNIGQRDNFWIVEGIALYFESLIPHNGYCTLGGLDVGRVPAARVRLGEGFYVPFTRLTALGTREIQQDPNIAKLYSQAAGQTTFLMHGGAGQYRTPLVDYLIAVYSNRADARTLFQLTNASGTELDRQYQAFMQSGE